VSKDGDERRHEKRAEERAVQNRQHGADAGSASEHQRDDTQRRRRRYDRHTWAGLSFNQKLIITFQGLIFAVTTAYAIFAALQWRATRRQADVAEKGFVLTRETVRATLVFVGASMPKDIREDASGITHVEMSFKFKNAGATYARHVRLDSKVVFFGLFRASIPNTFTCRREEIPLSGVIGGQDLSIGPDEEFENGGLVGMDAGQFEGVVDGRVVLQIRGSLVYVDIFGEAHSEPFCGQLMRDVTQGQPPAPEGPFHMRASSCNSKLECEDASGEHTDSP
jgi:hypothetical protein